MTFLLAALRLYTRFSPFKRGRGVFIRLIELGKRIGLSAPSVEIGADLVMEFEPSLLGWTVFERGVWEPEQTRLIANMMRPGGVVVDVGANTGYYALLTSQAVGPTGQVYAFEMQPPMIAILRRNIGQNGLQNVTVIEAACWSTSGEAAIELHGDPGSARLNLDSDGATVQLTTVDAFSETAGLSRLDFILIDAEGADFEVLKGACYVLERFRPIVLAETHHLAAFGGSEEAMRAYMERFGYAAKIVVSEFSRDVLFLPAEIRAGVNV